jgi:death-on-curing family protein
MKNKNNKATLAEIAKEANRGLDDSLVTLWDAGLAGINEPIDELKGSKLSLARRSLGLPSKKDYQNIIYWKNYFALKDEEFKRLLNICDIQIGPNASRLPKGAIKKLLHVASDRKFVIRPPKEIISAPITQVISVTTQTRPLIWEIIGQRIEVFYLTCEEVLSIHDILVKDFLSQDDPIVPSGPTSDNIVESTVFRQHTAIGEQLKYPTVEMASAALLHSLIHNHPFRNGNKRTALVALLVLLDKNNFMITCHENDLFKFVLQVSQHKVVDPNEVALPDREVIAMSKWIAKNSRPIEKGEKTLTFRRLRQLLTDFDCTFERASGSSNMKIIRKIEKVRKIKNKIITLHTNIPYGGDRYEISRSAIKGIRNDLQLTEENGIDSAAFYEKLPFPYDEFIIKYRKTLNRLSKL